MQAVRHVCDVTNTERPGCADADCGQQRLRRLHHHLWRAAASCTISVVFTPISPAQRTHAYCCERPSRFRSRCGQDRGDLTATAAGIPTTILANQSAAITVTVTATGALTGLSCTPVVLT